MEPPVIVVSARRETNAAGAPLVQYELRCPLCGAEQPWNLYAKADLPPSLECPACGDGYETATRRFPCGVSFLRNCQPRPSDR